MDRLTWGNEHDPYIHSESAMLYYHYQLIADLNIYIFDFELVSHEHMTPNSLLFNRDVDYEELIDEYL